ncbi:acyl-CoA/acyl-ACP dehydrogenase [Candidatus Bathyarchaeota archaeon]|nr:acyl-CoA/acyl-ACP dehydrogenase [Candidatus Bathyarchaeota archaeon]
MDFSFTEEQELIRKAVREWCTKNLSLEKVREMDTKQTIPQEVIKGMADLGILFPSVPREHGGAGLDWVTACIIAEEVGYADITIAIPAGFCVVEGAWGWTLDKYCSETVRREYVQPAIRGEKFVGIATTEPEGGSDVAAFKSTARKEGNEWVINGEKMYISGIEEAKRMGGGYWITVRTSPAPPERPHLGMTSFFLPIDAPGVEATKRFDDMGRMAISTAGFTMNDVRLSDDYRIGEVGKGFYITMEGFDNARLVISASAVGVATRALEIGMNYTKTRKLFGQPIAKYQGISFEMADLAAETEAIRALVYKTAWMNDKKYQENKFSTLEVTKFMSMIKLLSPHHALETIEKAMIWMGAYGYTKECPLEMGLRGLFSYCIGAEGALNIQRIVIVRELLGKEFR